MRVPFVVTPLLLVGGLAAAAPPDAVDELVRAEMERQQIPGLALVIARDGADPDLRGYGLANLELEVPVTADTIFQSGSIGKQFTAAGVLLLAEEGKLALDDPLARHFPEAPPAWHRIRIRHLLTHTSGLKDYGEDEIDFRRDYSEDELLKVAMRVPLDFEPGSQWSYSNTGYMLLGILISKRAEQHWSEYLKRRVFEPAGMTTTRVISEAEIVKHRAAGYEPGPQGQLHNQAWVAPSLNRLGDGALYFSARDLAAWDAALRERRVLSEASYAAWWTPAMLADGTSVPYGFGWGIEDQRGWRAVRHGGAWQGFRADIARFEEDGLTLAVLTNRAGADPERVVNRLAGLLDADLRLPDLDPEPLPQDPDPAASAARLGVLAAFGAYRTLPQMGRGLAAIGAGSAREAFGRRRTAEAVAAQTGFHWLSDDDLRARPLERRGERVTRIAWYRLEGGERPALYCFYLTADGRVADFAARLR